MSGITLVLQALYGGERHLEAALLAAAERHRADHEVHHVATDLARWSREHGDRLAEASRHHGLVLDETAAAAPEAADGQDAAPTHPGLLLLRDLTALHLAAGRNSLHWEMLAQVAQATRDDRLAALASDCHPQTLRQMRWCNTLLKNLSPQVLASMA
ncbi:hypothetical protein AB0B01_15410 [Streptomyces sp. NPDC044571]|uniref:hypothetical protein n=1 Tax=Streptomyces sp. NPDC044571 TaxID=3155371 RepID=UPI0033E73BA8